MAVDIEACLHHVAAARANNDPLTAFTARLAGEVADRMRAEFGTQLDMETVGIALTIAASVVVPLCQPDIPGTVIANLIALTGEDLVREARHG